MHDAYMQVRDLYIRFKCKNFLTLTKGVLYIRIFQNAYHMHFSLIVLETSR